jgi:O-antigen/teichoic acid export membrane protein
MRSSLLTEQQTALFPAGLLVLARIANMGATLATIPLLIHFLGGEGFAFWAVLLAAGAAFSALGIGMGPTFVKHAAPLIQRGHWKQVNVVLNHTATIQVLVFALAAPLVLWFSGPVARQLQLPDGEWLTAAQMIVLVYAAIALRALLQFGALTFNAARRFRALATVAFLQSFASNFAAAVAAISTRRVDVTLIAYWGTQLAILAVADIAARRLYLGKMTLALPAFGMLREFVAHGLKIQVCDWAQIINFQFDKFLIASSMGLWAVAPYEVGNRSVLALRSIPSSGLESFLATAAIDQQSGDHLWLRYQEVTRLAATAVIVFMIAPLAVAPVFLYAWTGEMGYVARWVFFALLLGAACDVLALPAAAMAQAAGRADIQARSAIASILINIPLSLLFVLVLDWGLVGAACGTAVAMLASSALLMFDVHRAYKRPLSTTSGILLQFWPLLVVCLICGALVHFPFGQWLASLDAGTRFSREHRVYPGLLSGVAYLACLALMAGVQIHRGALSREQYDWLSRWIRFKWFVSYCAAKAPVQRNPVSR